MLGVVIINMGTPNEPTPAAVRQYLKELLSDRNLVDMPPVFWKPILNLFILPHRPKKTAPLYRLIWTKDGSPFLMASLAQQAALQNRLRELLDEEVHVTLGMRYGNPSIESALSALKDFGLGQTSSDTIIALPMYPQRTRSCADTSFQKFDEVFKELFKSSFQERRRKSKGCTKTPFTADTSTRFNEIDSALSCAKTPRIAYGSAHSIRTLYIDHYWDAFGYIEALATSIQRLWTWQPGSKLVVSFHSIPLSHVDAQDPYPKQTQATTRALARALDIPTKDIHLVYQSPFDKRKWLGPFLKPTLSRLAKEQVKNVAIVCPGFSVDCLETLHGVDIVAVQHFKEECKRFHNEGAHISYIPALGADPALIDVLAHLIMQKTQK